MPCVRLQGVEPVTFGPLPQLQDAVTVVGYPIGERRIQYHNT